MPLHAQAQSDILIADQDIYVKVWKDKSRQDKAVEVEGGININAPAETIWDIMLDCEQALIIVPKMRVCEVLETSNDGSWDIREQKIRIAPLIPKSVSIFRSDFNPYQSIKISLMDGSMAVQEGIWTLDPIDTNKTRVSYWAALKPKFPVPNGILKNGVRKDVPKLLQNLKTQSENRVNFGAHE